MSCLLRLRGHWRGRGKSKSQKWWSPPGGIAFWTQQGSSTHELTAVGTAFTNPRQVQARPNPSLERGTEHTTLPLANRSTAKGQLLGEGQFHLSVVGMSTMLPWKPRHPRIFGQHKSVLEAFFVFVFFVYLFILSTQSWVEREGELDLGRIKGWMSIKTHCTELSKN